RDPAQRRVWRNGEGGLTFGLEITGRSWRRLIMRFHVFVISVRVEHHLVSENFMIGGEISAVTLAFREGGGGQIEVKPRSDAAQHSDATSVVKVGASRS